MSITDRRFPVSWARSALVLLAALAAGLEVRAVSSRPGLVFTERERVDVRARVQGAAGPATVEYTLREVDGPWRSAGSAPITPGPDGAGEAPLPLKVPGRGLYDLALTARCGEQSAGARTSVAVVFAPLPPEARSPWGVFYIPAFGRQDPEAAAEVARNIRMLGASWARYNFWAHTYGKVTVTEGETPTASADLVQAKREVAALRREGIHILGEIAQIPRPLSSRPDATDQSGDAGPLWCRVKPRDYRLWGQLVEQVAAAFREEIQVWEILNEADIPNAYWSGTPAEFAEFVEHTARALRRGNPKARIAAAGFTPARVTGGKERARLVDEVLALGLTKHLDLFTVHYTDARPAAVERWRELLAQEGAGALPIWNTEERPAVPIRWLSSGDGPFFKFLHIQFTDAYDSYGPMVRKDLTLLPDGVEFSVGARLIGSRRFTVLSAKDAPGFATYHFGRDADAVAVVTRSGAAAGAGAVRLFDEPSRLVLAVEPAGKAAPAAFDRFGRALPVQMKAGRAEVPYAPTLFVTGCRAVSVAECLRDGGTAKAVVAEAEAARLGPGWGITDHAGFSGGKTVDIWSDTDPADPAGYWVEAKMTVPAAGEYEVLFSGNSLSRLRPPSSLSPFVWRLDDGAEQPVPEKVKVLPGIEGAPEGLSVLGAVRLPAGEHTFRLRLTGRRQTPDQNWALWFDAVALRARGEGNGAMKQ